MPSGSFEGYYRVTEILEPYNGLSEIEPSVLENAAKRGDAVHRMCELYAEGCSFVEPTAECKEYVESFKEWFDETIEEVISLEERFFCDDLKITGQADMIALVKGDRKPSIIDFKTPQSVSKTWNLQLAAYKHLATKKHPVHRCFALQLSRYGGKAKVVENENHERNFYIYKGILEAHKYFYPL